MHTLLTPPGSRSVAVVVLAAALIGLACSAAPTPVDVARPLPQRLRQFLVPPVTTGVGIEAADRIQSAHRALVERGDVEGAAEEARQLLRAGLGQQSARVLMAQADLADGRADAVVAALEPLLEDVEADDAFALVLGRAAELEEKPIVAYLAYGAGDISQLASRKAAELEPRALALAAEEVRAALDRGRLDLAEQWLATLESWSPSAPESLKAVLDVSRARNDLQGELEALRALRARIDLETAELVRLARLELEVGDAQAGVDAFEMLAERFPDDLEIRDGLAAAKFRWRLDMLPEDASSLVRSRSLSRGDFATLLYWIVPGIRSDRSTSGEIVSDVLDHPQRAAIVRVVNLGVMRVDDAARHRFAPDKELSRAQALQSLLQLPSAMGAAPGCLASYASNPAPSPTAICEAAERCGLVAKDDSCLPGSAISGSEASEAVRRLLLLMESGASP